MQKHKTTRPQEPDKASYGANAEPGCGDAVFTSPTNAVLDALPIGVLTFDNDLRIADSNPKAASLVDIGEHIDKSLESGTDSKIWQDWTGRLKSIISGKNTVRFDSVSYTSTDTGKSKVLRITCIPHRQADGNETGGMIIEDLTEKTDIQKQLANAEKMAAVGKLASKIAHDLNNPMDGILRYINLTLRIIEQEKLEKPKSYLIQCQQELHRMIQITSELLEFSRSTYALLDEYVKIEQAIEDSIKTMDGKAETAKIRILRNYSPGIPKIKTGNLFQVFCNLIKNAIEAMPNGGELSVSTHLQDGNIIAVEFRDTGKGFPAENAEKIFEPFFTTKQTGTGLGLAICNDIVTKHHGRITASNSPSGGSIFTVYLPIAANP